MIVLYTLEYITVQYSTTHDYYIRPLVVDTAFSLMTDDDEKRRMGNPRVVL
jgi:hypothetical protein